ncbi:hypothetical protein FGO68_gene890 [Halteria grandinella]|uniref:Uncharacterized protein n=1 Tax=Halteria grandinella TaxID=5974 RepID=A0A8J8T260_HALGN|nr:hypothetical protein FGO68_gene890 [Halteria grandinella]
MIKTYEFINHPDTKEAVQQWKDYFQGKRVELKDGLTKYNNFIFWWKVDSDRWGSSFTRYWRFRKAYNEGMFDLMFVGLIKGYRNGDMATHQEQFNALRLQELDIEVQMLRLRLEIEKLTPNKISKDVCK